MSSARTTTTTPIAATTPEKSSEAWSPASVATSEGHKKQNCSNNNSNNNNKTATTTTTTTVSLPYATSWSKANSHNKMTLLAEDFTPGDNDVICGRGKKCYQHVGNDRFRRRVRTMLDDYSQARSKLDKSGVLSAVVEQVRRASPGGGFVKQDESGRWYEVGDFLAREKTSQAFRDALHEVYKSSNVAKKKKRQEEQARASDKLQRIARSEHEISARLERLSSEILNARPDEHVSELLQKNNYGFMSGYGGRISTINEHSASQFGSSVHSAFRYPEHQQQSGGMYRGQPDPLFGGRIGAGVNRGLMAGSHRSNVGPGGPIRQSYSDSEVHVRQQQPSMMSRHPYDTTQQQQSQSQQQQQDYHYPIMRSRSYSNPPRPVNLYADLMGSPPPSDDEGTSSMQQEGLHHSLPNIHFSSSPALGGSSSLGEFSEQNLLPQQHQQQQEHHEEEEAFHHSMPSLNYTPDAPELDPLLPLDPYAAPTPTGRVEKPLAKEPPTFGGGNNNNPVKELYAKDSYGKDLPSYTGSEGGEASMLRKLAPPTSRLEENPFEPLPLSTELKPDVDNEDHPLRFSASSSPMDTSSYTTRSH